MKTATLQDALNARPCYSEERIRALFGKRKTLNVKQIARLDIPDRDKLWALTRPHFLDTKEKAVRFAVFCAEQSLPIFEARFSGDHRPRAAIEAAKAWLQNPTASAAAAAAAYDAAADSLVTAARAAYAAEADAADADDAADAADAAARAVYAAATAEAYAPAAAAEAAAYAAAAAADSRGAQVKYLVELLTATE